MHFTILSLNPGYDRWALIEKPSPLPRVTRAARAYSLPAGKGIDVARCLHRLGHEDYSCFTFLGGRHGEAIREACAAEGLRLAAVPIAGENRLNHTSVYLYSGDIFTVNEEGPTLSLSEREALKRQVKEELASHPDAVLTVCGTACPGFTPENFCELSRHAKETGHAVAIDIGGASLEPLAGTAPTLLKINREEFQLAFGFDGWERNETLLRWLADSGIPCLILTDGAAGACAHTAEESQYALLPEGCGGAYSVGCGDAFFGGYLSAWSEGLSLSDRLRRANACGVSNSRDLRCGAVDAEEVRALESLSRVCPAP